MPLLLLLEEAVVVEVHPSSSDKTEERDTEESSVQEKVAVSMLVVRVTPLASAEAREPSLKLGSRYLGMTTMAVFFGESELVKSITWTGLWVLLVVNSKTEQLVMGDMTLAGEVESSANIDNTYVCLVEDWIKTDSE